LGMVMLITLLIRLRRCLCTAQVGTGARGEPLVII